MINGFEVPLRNIDNTFLWEGVFDTGNVKHFEKLSFSTKFTYAGFLKTYEATVPFLEVISSSPYIFIRLFANKSNDEDALSEIIIDLINRVAHSNIKECLLQLESLTKQIEIRRGDSQHLPSLEGMKFNEKSCDIANDVRKVTKLTRTNVIAYCYFLSVVGAGFQVKVQSNIERFFSRKAIHSLLLEIQQIRREDLPSTCIRTIASILPDLFKFCYQKNSSFLLYMSFTCHLIDESAMLLLIKHSQKGERGLLFPIYEKQGDFDCIPLLLRLYDTALVNDNFELLEYIIAPLPGYIHRQFLETVNQKKKCMHAVLEKAIGDLEIKEKKDIWNFRKKNDLEGILNLWKNISFSVLQNISEDVIQMTEKAILSCLERIPVFTCRDLLHHITNDTRLFNDSASCLKVMKLFSTSKNVEIRSLFINLLNHEKFVSLETKDTQKLLENWFSNELENTKLNFKHKSKPQKSDENSQQKMIVNVYYTFADTMKTDYLRKHGCIQQAFERMIFTFLQDCSFKALILVVRQNIEKDSVLLEIQETVSMHIRMLLKNEGKRPDVLMQDICGTEKLLVNSR